MKFSRTLPCALAICFAIAPLSSYGQFVTGGTGTTASATKPAAQVPPAKKGGDPNPFLSSSPDPMPWDPFHLSKTKKVLLNFKNASPDSLLAFLSNASGITIIKDPSFKDLMTVTTAKRVSLSEAFNIVNTYLGLKNLQFVKTGNVLVVKAKDQGGPGAGFQFPQGVDFGNRDENRSLLKVYPIHYANAAEVARIVNEVFAPLPGAGAAQQQGFGRGGGGRFGGGQGGRFGGGGAIQVNLGGGQPDQSATASRQPQVKASSDDFSNSVIVNAPQVDQDQVDAFIKQIDKQTEQPIEAQVYHLNYAVANDIAASVQNVLVATAPKGRGGTGQQNVPFGQQIGAALRFGSASAAFGNVVADSRTNSLVVSSTKDNQAVVKKLIDDLDKPVTVLDTTTVYRLKNAKADTVTQLLQDAFGNRQGVSGSGYNYNTGTNTRSSTTITNRQGSQTGTTAAGADNLNDPNIPANASATTDPVAAALGLALQNPTADPSQILTTVGVQGFGGGGGGGFFRALGGGGQGGGTGNSLPGSGTSRDPSGQVVPTHDLAGQVTVIPDINTNSVIIVTPPEFLDAVKRILDALDKIPDQVIIETLIVEANLDSTNNWGLEWTAAQNKFFGKPGANAKGSTNFGLAGQNPAAKGFVYSLTGGSISTFLNLLQTDVKYNVISTPRIITSNNQTAEINVSQKVPYLVSTTFNANNEPTYTYGYQNVGVVLTVTPRISANGFVTLDIDQQDNDLQSYTSFNAPIINQREANTSVSVQDGKTLILGGIIRNTVSATINKVPLLGDLPLLGNLFRQHSVEKQRTELLVFMTPHVVRAQDDADAYARGTVKQASPGVQDAVNQFLHLDKQKAVPAKPGSTSDDKTKGSNS
jgi:general secretion pathway protein D